MKKFATYSKDEGDNKINFTFIPASKPLGAEAPIDAVLGVVMIGDSYVLVKKQNGWWDIPGGKREDGESLVECLYREIREEAGIDIDTSNTRVIGHVRAENNSEIPDERFHKTNIMPIYLVFGHYIDRDWLKNRRETTERALLSIKKARKVLETRNDNGQLLEIIEYAHSFYQSLNPEYTFTFVPAPKMHRLALAPVTQVMALCSNSDQKYCIVRDYDEDFFSLPGGGCELDETPLAAMKRELYEESQISGKNFSILGTVLVVQSISREVIASTQHLRYMCSIDKIEDFIPRNKGFEIAERAFIPKDELYAKVKLLNNATGQDIISHI